TCALPTPPLAAFVEPLHPPGARPSPPQGPLERAGGALSNRRSARPSPVRPDSTGRRGGPTGVLSRRTGSASGSADDGLGAGPRRGRGLAGHRSCTARLSGRGGTAAAVGVGLPALS